MYVNTSTILLADQSLNLTPDLHYAWEKSQCYTPLNHVYISIKQTVKVKLKVCEIWIQNSPGKRVHCEVLIISWCEIGV